MHVQFEVRCKHTDLMRLMRKIFGEDEKPSTGVSHDDAVVQVEHRFER